MVENVTAVDQFAEHGVFEVDVRLLRVRDKKLRAVRIGAAVRHGNDAPRVMLERVHDLVVKGFAPDAGALLAGARRVPGLHHEAPDVAVEEVVVVATARAEGQEVLARPRGFVAVQLELEVAEVGVQGHRHRFKVKVLQRIFILILEKKKFFSIFFGGFFVIGSCVDEAGSKYEQEL